MLNVTQSTTTCNTKSPKNHNNNHSHDLASGLGSGLAFIHGINYLENFIEDHHRKEYQASAIANDTSSLNFRSLSGNTAWGYLLYSEKLERTNTGRLSAYLLKTYAHIDKGGWWCSGVDLIKGSDDCEWGHFKADFPRTNKDGKLVKYEAPPQTAPGVFALKVPARIWKAIAHKYDVALPENYQSLPFIAFWQWVQANPQIPVIVTEGAKKAACMLSCGFVCVALPGVTMGARTPKDEYGNVCGCSKLIPELEYFAQAGREIILAFDADSKQSSIRNVSQSLEKLGKLFLYKKCQVTVMVWQASQGKGIDDVVARHGQEQLDHIYSTRISFDSWQTKQLNRLTYPASLLCNDRYLPEFIPPVGKQLIGIKSAKGTGKSFQIRNYLSPFLSTGERKILVLMHRVQLGLQFCNELGLSYIDEENFQIEGNLFGFGMCVNSLHDKSKAKFNPQDWKGAILIIDEVCQFVWHVITDSNLRSERIKVLKTFKELLNVIINSGGKIIIADADLNDIVIDLFRELINIDINPYLIVNEYKFEEKWQVCNFTQSSPATLLRVLEQQLAEGRKILLEVTGKQVKSKFGSRILEAWFSNLLKDLEAKFPNKKILRIDADSVVDKHHEAYRITSNIKHGLSEYDLVIVTPVIETGVSIEDIKDENGNVITQMFDAVFGIFQGVQTANSVRQFLSRYRGNAPRYIWCSSRGINNVGNGSINWKVLSANEYHKDIAIRKDLMQSSITIDEDSGNPFSPWFKAWAKMGALINLGNKNYRNTIVDDIKTEGHLIGDNNLPARDNSEESIQEMLSFALPSKEDADSLKDCLKELSEVETEKECIAVSESEDVGELEFEKLKKQKEKTNTERLQYHKARIKNSYGIEVTPELVKRDFDGWYSKIRLHYLLTVGRHNVKALDVMGCEKAYQRGDGDIFLLDRNKSYKSLKVAALEILGIHEFLAVDHISDDHELISEMISKLETDITFFRTCLGLKINLESIKEKPMQFVQSLVGLIGYKFPKLGRKGSRKDRKNIYGKAAPDFEKDGKDLILDVNGNAIPIFDNRDEVFQVWLIQDKERLENHQLEKENQEFIRQVEQSGFFDSPQQPNQPQPQPVETVVESIENLKTNPKIISLANDLAFKGQINPVAIPNISVYEMIAIQELSKELKAA
jgi:hypothetical protein